MPLLVIPLAPGEAERLTLGEWDALVRRRRVLFEVPGHPLAARLEAAGIEAGPFDDEPDASWGGWALVTEPDSPRVIELARAGAEVWVGTIAPPDDLTAAHGAYVARAAADELSRLALIMARLRGPDGCPWDAKQTHASLGVHLAEESHEVLESIEAGALGDELAEELGDVLLQVFFHAQLAADDGRFDLRDVARAINAKLVRRHPHVFAGLEVEDADEELRNRRQIKSEEKGGAARPDFDEGALERALDRVLEIARKKEVDARDPLRRKLAKLEGSA